MIYRVLPRINTRFEPALLGYRFTYCLLNTGGRLQVIIETRMPEVVLQKLAVVERYDFSILQGVLGERVLVAEARLADERDFWLKDTVITDPPGLTVSLKPPVLLCLGASRDHVLDAIFRSKARSLLEGGSRGGGVEARLILERAGRGVWSLRITIAASSESTVSEAEDAVSAASSTRLKWVEKKAGFEALPGLLEPFKFKFLDKLFTRSIPVACGSAIYDSIVLPDPSFHPVDFARGRLLPETVPLRSSSSFRIGVTPSGREVRLSLGDLARHVYVVGQTGSGKTSFLKLLVYRVRENSSVGIIVVDPHGDMSRELHSMIPEARFYDPLEAPFGLNPLDLPRHRDREHAVTVAIDVLLSIFEDILKLMATAVNVRYLLRVVLRYLYSKSDSPTMADVYNTILELYEGRSSLEDTRDAEWRRQVAVLRSMQRQSLISALSRLEPYARDKLLRKLTSRTTIDMRDVMKPASVTLFSTPKASLGEELARLVASTIVLKTWYEVLARARLGEPRTPVLLVVDEFQLISDLPVLDTVLSEARKYGLHLVIAHQHTGQLPEHLIQSLLTNTGVKVVFQVAGGDARRLSSIDADYAGLLEKTLTSLPVGTAVLKVTGQPSEPPPPPVIVKLDRVE